MSAAAKITKKPPGGSKSKSKSATTTTGLRGSIKHEETKRKQVFKQVLSNPYASIAWPVVPIDHLRQITDLLLSGLENEVKQTSNQLSCNVITGFNTAVKALEAQTREMRYGKEIPDSIVSFKTSPKTASEGGNPSKSSVDYVPPIVAVFVCRADISTPLLYSCFPQLCVLASGEAVKVKLISLPRGTLAEISRIAGRPSCGIVCLRQDAPGFKHLFQLISQFQSDGSPVVADLQAPWLTGNVVYMKPNILQLETTAPLQVKKAKGKS